MFASLLAPIIGVIAALLYGINTFFWPWVIFLVALLRFIPMPSWQKRCDDFLHQLPVYWSDINSLIICFTARTKWEIKGLENLKTDDWYMMISNHQSWTDIFVLEHVFNHKTSPLRIFMKKELLWSLPIIGLAAKLIDFPILYRHTKEYLAKHPDQKGKDIETTRKACEKFKNIPTTIISFIEGTRFTPEKHQRQSSPYRYLLRPKAGGMAFILASMGKYLHKILNVTIIYPAAAPNLWDFFCGKIPEIIVQVECLPLTPEMLGDYESDREFRVRFQSWINDLWLEKDKTIAEVMAGKTTHHENKIISHCDA